MKRTKILDVVVFFSLILIIVSTMPLIAEHGKTTICRSCEAQNWTGELPAVDMKINCSEIEGRCEEMNTETEEPQSIEKFWKGEYFYILKIN